MSTCIQSALYRLHPDLSMHSGSGKSTLAVQFEALCPSRFTRVNQDSLGSRKKCEDLARASIEKVRAMILKKIKKSELTE